MAKSGINIYCHVCNTTTDFPEPTGEPKVNSFGQYENPAADCPGCEKLGISTRHFVVLSIPESEFEENEIDNEEFFPPGEYEKRQAIRALMWRYRPDLKTKDRAKHESEIKAKTEKAKGKTVETIRAERKVKSSAIVSAASVRVAAAGAAGNLDVRKQKQDKTKQVEAAAAKIIANLNKPTT